MRRRIIVGVVASALCLSGRAVHRVAPEELAQGELPVDERARTALQEMSKTLASASELAFHAEITFDDVLPSGQKLQYSAMMDAALLRPDRLFVEWVSDLGGRRVWYDGEALTVYDGPENVYGAFAVSGPVDEALRHALTDRGVSVPLADLVARDPYASLTADVVHGTYVGLHDVQGTACHHLAFVQQLIEWQIWIDSGPEPLPRKLVINYKTIPNAPQFVAVLSDWDLAPRWGRARFRADIPEDASPVEFVELTKTAKGGGGR